MDDVDLETLIEIRIESMDNLGDAEGVLLRIEAYTGDERLELVNQVFRAFHTVKGTAGFFDLHLIVHLAHSMENLLSRVREGEIPYLSGMTDVFLRGVDKLNQLLDALPEVIDLPIEEELEEISQCNREASEAAGHSPAVESESPESAAVTEVVGAQVPVAATAEESSETMISSEGFEPIELPRVLTIAHVSDLKETMMATLERAPSGVVLEFGEVERIDTAAIQLLAVFAEETRIGGVPLLWNDPPEELFSSCEGLDLGQVLFGAEWQPGDRTIPSNKAKVEV